MGRHLRSLLEVLDQQQALLAKIRQRLPAPLGEHLIGAHLQRRRLVLHVDTPAWASRLRYQAPTLARSLRPDVPGLEDIQVRIQPAQARRREQNARSIRLSAQAARHLRDTAAGLQDPALSAALQRLASCHEKG